jgi:uncharacterized protein YbaR (Trm112 family)
MDRKLLDILACPATRMPLAMLEAPGLDALNRAIAAGGLRLNDDSLQTALLREALGHPRPQDRVPHRRRHPGAAGRGRHRHRAGR